MATGFTDVGAQISIQEFFIKFFSMQGDNVNATASIPFRAFGPAGEVVLENLIYSVNGGTPKAVTLVNPPTGMAVGMSPSGELTTLTWDLGADFGVDFFNKNIMVTANVTDGLHTSPTAVGSLFVSRITKNRSVPVGTIANDNAVGSSINVNLLRKKR